MSEAEQAKGADAETSPAADAETSPTKDDADAASILDALDIERGELTDDDLETLEAAIHSIDFATRKATPERLERLTALQARLAGAIDEIRSGKRRPQAERVELSAEEMDRYHALVDEGVNAGERGDLEGAVRKLEEAVRANPDGLEGLFNLGVVYGLLAHRNIAKAEFYDDYTRDAVFMGKAQRCYDRVLEIDPEHLPSLNNLATLYSMLDNREAAVPLLKRIVGITAKGEDEEHIINEARSQLEELESI